MVLFMIFSTSMAMASEQHFKVLHVKDLEALMKGSTKSLAVYDVNVESTRSHVGIIPGARLLSGSKNYDVKKELPADKSAELVFYCANTQCTASHTAAEKAIEAGYKKVHVMVDGIYGWKSAGEPLEPVTKTPAPLEPKTVSELSNLHSAVIVDVRENEERHEVIKNVQWIPMSKVQDSKTWSEFQAQLPKDKMIVFHCAAGMRAKRAAEKLASDGFKTAYFQGPDQWRAAGLPLESGPAK